MLGWLVLLAGTARAGTWVQMSCVNPNGSAASSEGWSAGAGGPPAVGDSANTDCHPGSPLMAEQNNLGRLGAPPSVGSLEALSYTPPAGSTLAGGTVDVELEAYGYGTTGSPFTVAGVLSRKVVRLVDCTSGPTCSGNTFGPAVVSLPAGQGDTLAVAVGCADLGTSSTILCSQSHDASVFDRARVYWADLALVTNASPEAAGFQGSLLQRGASGTASLLFSASDPVGSSANPASGPGIYAVGVQIDGRTVYAGTPNANGGACVPVGGGGGQPLMFDGQQPCPPAETVDAPVPTSGLPDGRHRLTVTVTDAAGDTATVFDQDITTSNPQLTPVPGGPGRVRARFVVSWRWNGQRTTLLSARVRNLPANAAISLVCRGRGCRGLVTIARGASAVKRALRGLGGRRFSAGDRLYITVTAPGRKAERIALQIRDGRIPAARLLGG